MRQDFDFAPEYEYPGQWFDDTGATLLALGRVGIAWDFMKSDMPRSKLDELVKNLGVSGMTEGDLES